MILRVPERRSPWLWICSRRGVLAVLLETLVKAGGELHSKGDKKHGGLSQGGIYLLPNLPARIECPQAPQELDSYAIPARIEPAHGSRASKNHGHHLLPSEIWREEESQLSSLTGSEVVPLRGED